MQRRTWYGYCLHQGLNEHDRRRRACGQARIGVAGKQREGDAHRGRYRARLGSGMSCRRCFDHIVLYLIEVKSVVSYRCACVPSEDKVGAKDEYFRLRQELQDSCTLARSLRSLASKSADIASVGEDEGVRGGQRQEERPTKNGVNGVNRGQGTRSLRFVDYLPLTLPFRYKMA
jgi:hypothetical protein